jgi:P-type Mg2+ transporter
LHAAVDPHGDPSDRVRLHTYLNAVYETGFINPLDQAIKTQCTYDLSEYKKLDEVPYDFVRKRLSILAATPLHHVLITKGAMEQVLAVCSHVEHSKGNSVPITELLGEIRGLYQDFNEQDFARLA